MADDQPHKPRRRDPISVPDAIRFIVTEIAKVLPPFLDENRKVLEGAGLAGSELKRALAALELSSYEAALVPALKCMRELIDDDGKEMPAALRQIIEQTRSNTRH